MDHSLHSPPAVAGPRWPALLAGLILLALALPLAWGGVRLATLGGSWYYAVAAVLLLLTALLLLLRRPLALWAYGLLLLGTLAWALAEAGLDLWPLMPRTALWFVLAPGLLSPWVRRSLPAAPRGARALLWLGVGLTLVVWAAALTRSPHDTRGRLPMAAAAAAGPAASAVAGDWPTYGGSPYGQR